MQTMTPLYGSQKSDPQTIKQWAAEDFAINIGWLRECPYHGQPFKAKLTSRKKLAPALVDPRDPNVRVFNGNTRELLAAVERITGGYTERCAMCAASDQDDID
jgi:hypothetical protein